MLSPSESRALSLVALLLTLSAAARFHAAAGPARVATDAAEIDVAAMATRDSALEAGERRRTTPLRKDERLDLNAADAAELDRLPGVGPATARAIVARRDSVGPYTRAEELLEIRGIGPARLKRLAPLLKIDPWSRPPPPRRRP